ncbi:MAG: methyltransferase domain-containing protein [Acidobacteriota bacterium]|nr:methyltransferase domain-containing protein [Acidobacteriota bacterium]MDQ3372411.1 methyltransferase domain-containing protein [Acidobacteriota bacterium]
MFKARSHQLERIDTGDYTPEEYDVFLREIRLVNRFAGDIRALKKTLLREIKKTDLKNFSVLDVGAGSGELLRITAKFARRQNRKSRLYGLELNARSAKAILEESKKFAEISAVRGDARELPFADNSFDYTICSLFTHHFTDENVVLILDEISRVTRRKIYIIDLHRHPIAYFFYKIFCAGFRISPLVREDGSLSILRSFNVEELKALARAANLKKISVKRYFPFRLVLEAEKE